MKNILIPTDFSDNASDALKYALSLIGKTKANIHIVHVVQVDNIPSDIPIDTSDIVTKNLEEATKNMEAIEAFSNLFLSKEENTRINITTSVSVGLVASSIKLQAVQLGADLIIMGTQGAKRNFVEKMLGSISTYTISHAPCPVILVPSNYEFKPIDNVIFATNLNHSDPYELWRASELIKPHKFRIRCVHIITNREKSNKSEIEKFGKYMVENSPSIQTIFNLEESDSIENTLSEYVENYDAEMIIMPSSRNSFGKDLFGSRHTKKMVSWIKTPLMIMENKE